MQKNGIPKSFQIRVQEYCNELWNHRAAFNVEGLFAEVPPAMRVHLNQFLYSSAISRSPLFRGLSDEVIGALCDKAQQMYALKGDVVMEEGKPGRELYFLISGELEVSQRADGTTGRRRLGFLSEVANLSCLTRLLLHLSTPV
eukprot:SAG31_NODE_765_length_12248_cov_6.802947_14_plen_143_part_00